jgi:hypothetical protein
LNFTGDTTVNFSAYNSIIVTADVASQKALSLSGANTTNMVNCILGGLDGAAGSLGVIDDAAKNNKKSKTATFAGISGTLTNEGGNTQVLAIAESSNSDDFCTASTGISLPTVDQRGFTREGTPDAGAYEFVEVLSTPDLVLGLSANIYPNPARDIVHIEGLDNIEVLRFYSILGTLDKVIYNQSDADVSDLSAGMYILSIETSDNKKITKRLVIK